MKIILLFVFLLSNLCATLPVTTLPHGVLDISDFTMQYYIDTNNSYSYNEISKKPFTTTQSKVAMGYHKNQTVWFRFALNNDSNTSKEVYIYHKEGYKAREIVFYHYHNNTLMQSVDFSNKEEINQRTVQDSSPTFKVVLKPHSMDAFYIKSISRNSYLINIQLLDKRSHQKTYFLRNILYAFLFGILFALALYNALLFLSIKHSEYFYYVLFILGSISYLLYVSGLPLEYFSLSEATYTNFLFGVSLLQIFLIMFTRKVLDTQTKLPKADTYLRYLGMIPLSMFFIGLVFGIDKILALQALLAVIAAVSLLVVGVIAVKEKIDTATYYLLPIGFYLIFALIGIFAYFGVLPYNELTRNAFFYASLAEVFLLSLLLSNRIGILRTQAIESEQKLNAEIQSRNEVLKYRVRERTQELNDLNQSLETKIGLAVSEIRKKDEDLLRQSRMAMMGEMLSMIAHQWRQPLSTIVSIKNTMEIQISFDELDAKRLVSQLQDIDKHAQHMSKTVDDFSGFFKPNKRKEHFMLDELVETSILMMQNSYNKEKITISKDFNVTRKLLSFNNELLQVFLNLLKNAQDIFAETKIDNANMHISIREFDDRQELSFHDNAGGIPNSIINKIFEPYFSTKEEKNGTGLGLYMSKTIVKEHCKGLFEVKNEADGAKFTITLFFESD